MKVLVTGAGGQLGRALAQSAPGGVEVVCLDRAALDVTDAAAIEQCVGKIEPVVVINAAAYTSVDRAETEPERAFAVNAGAVKLLAEACSRRGARLVHISTDFVFDGAAGTPYRPQDPPNPVNVYGASKLAGERAIAALDELSWRIVRSAWLYASTGRNFVLTMLRAFQERNVVSVVADQVGTPTSARSLAHCVWRAAADEGPSVILHFTDAGVASWYDFAIAIYEESRALGLLSTAVDIVPISTTQYPTPARRPPYSVLDKTGTHARLGIAPVHWRTNLRDVLEELRK